MTIKDIIEAIDHDGITFEVFDASHELVFRGTGYEIEDYNVSKEWYDRWWNSYDIVSLWPQANGVMHVFIDK